MFLSLIPIALKMRYIIQLENIKGKYLPKPVVLGKVFLYWPFPYFRSRSEKKQFIIKRINAATAVFWGIWLLILFVELIYLTVLPD